MLVSDDPATGKSTLLKRVGEDLAALGRIVLFVKTLARVDIATAAYCLGQRTSPTAILVDNYADYAEQIRDLLDEIQSGTNVSVVGVERKYRREHIDVVMSDVPVAIVELGAPERERTRPAARKVPKRGDLLQTGDWRTIGRGRFALCATTPSLFVYAAFSMTFDRWTASWTPYGKLRAPSSGKSIWRARLHTVATALGLEDPCYRLLPGLPLL